MKQEKEYTQIAGELKQPIDQKALSPLYDGAKHSAVSPAYVYERLNDVFGIDGWTFTSELVKEIPQANGKDIYVVVKVTLQCRVGDKGVVRSQYGGNCNQRDVGDSYKGAVTDALTKCASMVYIAQDVYKGQQSHEKKIYSGAGTSKQQEKPTLSSNPAPSQLKETDQVVCGYLAKADIQGKITTYGEIDVNELRKQINYWKSNAKSDNQNAHLTICQKLLQEKTDNPARTFGNEGV